MASGVNETRLSVVQTQPRSVSQAQQYAKCPQQYWLSRIARDRDGQPIWQRPAAWLPMGTAVHAAAEAFERAGRALSLDDMQAVYAESYERETNEILAKGTMDTWSASGRYKGEADIERRWSIGLGQVALYHEYYKSGPGREELIWSVTKDLPAIEIPFEVEFDGVTVRGCIDAVVVMPDGKLRVRDNKTGTKAGDAFQLATYAAALYVQYGVSITTGDFWMGRTGKPTKPVDLSDWPGERVAAEFRAMDRAVKEGRFTATPDPETCRMCPVNSYCDFVAY